MGLQLGCSLLKRLSSVVQIERNSTIVASMILTMDFNWKEPRQLKLTKI